MRVATASQHRAGLGRSDWQASDPGTAGAAERFVAVAWSPVGPPRAEFEAASVLRRSGANSKTLRSIAAS